MQKLCLTCNMGYLSNGNTKWCLQCIEKQSICSLCGSIKWRYHNSCVKCAAKLRYQNNDSSRKILEIKVFDISCKSCHTIFKSKSWNAHFCYKCTDIRTICKNCGWKKKTIYNTFCSHKCSSKWNSKHNINFINSFLNHCYPKAHTIDANKKISNKLKNKPKYNLRGHLNPNWKWWIYNRKTLMGRIEYISWREAVFKRDNYICVLCYKRGGELNADHIVPYIVSKDIAMCVPNWQTLCIKCHKKTDTWGHKVHKLSKKDIKQKYINVLCRMLKCVAKLKY